MGHAYRHVKTIWQTRVGRVLLFLKSDFNTIIDDNPYVVSRDNCYISKPERINFDAEFLHLSVDNSIIIL